jgi:hypothetical protein
MCHYLPFEKESRTRPTFTTLNSKRPTFIQTPPYGRNVKPLRGFHLHVTASYTRTESNVNVKL